MTLVRFETQNFSFMGLSESKEKGLANLKKAWKNHCKDYPADPNYLIEYEEDIQYMEVQLNEVYRDYDRIL